MNEPFDCVRNAREVRDKISAEIRGMSHAQLVRWLRTREYLDPVLKRLAERAAAQADAAGNTARRR